VYGKKDCNGAEERCDVFGLLCFLLLVITVFVNDGLIKIARGVECCGRQ
jgi:hypothetical protein